MQYKNLVLKYWAEVPLENVRSISFIARQTLGQVEPLSTNALLLREEITAMMPEVIELANELGVSTMVQSIPPPAVGGVIIPINLLHASIDQMMGHGQISRIDILDRINMCIGASQTMKRNKFRRLMNPLYWPVDILTLAIRLPFIVLRRAGLPQEIENNIVANIVKVLLLVFLLWFAARWGKNIPIKDMLHIIGK